MLPDPIYDAYEAPIALWGSSPAPIHTTPSNGRFIFNRPHLEGAWVTGTDVILLNTPWNPVGTVLSHDELVDIMGFAEQHDYLTISDEIYESLIYDGRRHVSPASVSADARERTIVINSLSKTYAMTGCASVTAPVPKRSSARCSSYCSSRAVGRPRLYKMPRPWP